MTVDSGPDRYDRPKLVFKPVEGKHLTYELAAAYYDGCFTMTGIRDHHIQPIVEWCAASDCGRRMAYNMFAFKNQAQAAMFMLRWANTELKNEN